MEALNHPHMMSLLGVCLDAGPAPYIVLPYMGNGDLLSFLKKNRDSLLVTPEEDNDEVYTHFIVAADKLKYPIMSFYCS